MENMMFEAQLEQISGLVWGAPMLLVMVGTGVFLTLRLRMFPWRNVHSAVRLLFSSSRDGSGAILPSQALMTALAATVGTGNIAGVATAIYLGGPGAVFWMWLMAMFGMAIKYAEAVLAVEYRVEGTGNQPAHGGPMHYLEAGFRKKGLSRTGCALGYIYAIFASVAAFGIGNMVQSNSIAAVAKEQLGLMPEVTGVLVAAMVGLVLLGGIRRIANVATVIVPIMAIGYVGAAAIILVFNAERIDDVFIMIVSDAISGTAATGGFAGATVWAAMRFGIARGVFSNEAGLGTAAIAHAAAKTRRPVDQGLIAMLGTVIDTLLVCTMTALVILTSTQEINGVLISVWSVGENGANLTSLAFESSLPGSEVIVAIGLFIFAFTTLLGWSYYGEQSASYVAGKDIRTPYRIAWLLFIVVGAYTELNLVWIIADIFNGLMALPNLIGLLFLSGVVFKLTKKSRGEQRGRLQSVHPS